MVNEVGKITIKSDTTQVRKGTKDLKGMEKQSARTEKRASQLGSTMGRVAGIVGAGLFARAAIRNTIRQEQAIAQLNSTLRATGRYSDETSRALLDQAAAFQEVTTFGDESVIEMQSMLLTFKNLGGEVVPRASAAILDMSVKMGQDLKSSVVQVGKALNDPILGMTAMTRVGVTFTEEQKNVVKAMLKTGDLAGAQAILLKELESEFGGAARAARDTFGGALSSLGNAFGDLLEADGDSLPGVTSSINELTDTLQSEEVKQGFQVMIGGLLKIIEVAAKMPATIGFVVDEVKAIFGDIADDDIPRLEDRIEDLRKDIKAGEEMFVLFPDLEIFGTSHNSLLAKKRAELADIEKLVDDFYNKPRDQKPLVDLTTQAIPGLEAGEAGKSREQLAQEAREAAQAEREWQKVLDEGSRASNDLRESLEELSAARLGPAQEAALAYDRALGDIAEKEAKLLAAGQLNAEQEQVITDLKRETLEVYRAEIDAIEESARAKAAEAEAAAAQATVAEQIIQDLEFEMELMKLNNVEREKAIALRYAEGSATEDQKAKIASLIEGLDAENEAIGRLDEIRGGVADIFVAAADGADSAGEAFDRFMDRMRQRLLAMIAEKLIEQLFGAFGSSGGGLFGSGGGGGGFAGLLGGLFGRATGGPVSPGGLYQVNEKGSPELLTVGDKQYLMTGDKAGVVSNPVTNNNSSVSHITVNLPSEAQPRTAQQMAQEVDRVQKRATARNT